MPTLIVQAALVLGVLALLGPVLYQSHRRRVAAVRRDTARRDAGGHVRRLPGGEG